MSNIVVQRVTLSGIVTYLNNTYKKKQSGKKFTMSDVQQYIRLGHLPYYLGKIDIVLTETIDYIKFYNLIEKE